VPWGLHLDDRVYGIIILACMFYSSVCSFMNFIFGIITNIFSN